jgi:hypothetical protein
MTKNNIEKQFRSYLDEKIINRIEGTYFRDQSDTFKQNIVLIFILRFLKSHKCDSYDYDINSIKEDNIDFRISFNHKNVRYNLSFYYNVKIILRQLKIKKIKENEERCRKES